MSNKPTPCLGQIWTYVTRNPSEAEEFDETILLIAKDIAGEFEYKTLFGKRGTSTTYTTYDLATHLWVFDPEAKSSQYWRDKNE